MQSLAEKLELHYYLKDEQHTMDALIRNKCEAEILAILEEISNQLGFQVQIETSAYIEGGLKEIWKILGRNNNQITLLLTIVIIILSRMPMPDSELDDLKKQEAKLSIEEKKLTIEKLKREIEGGNIGPKSAEAAFNALSGNLKVAARKSNFYKSLSEYSKVTGVGLLPLDKNNKPTADENYIPQSDFKNFIIFTNTLPTEIIDDAEIEIISPVLKEGNYRWKGMYQDMPISFTMNDVEFKDSVMREEISFQHGSIIQCANSGANWTAIPRQTGH